MSRDHKPELEAERERIQSAGGYIQMGRVNGTLNLSRAIDILFFTRFFLFIVLTLPDVLHMQNTFHYGIPLYSDT